MSRPTGLKRLRKVGMSRRVDSSEDQENACGSKSYAKDEQSTKPDDSTTGEAVTTASVEESAAPTTIEEITLA
ncbi:hypothetical protein Tco_0143828 [Tanacetum coccineum]